MYILAVETTGEFASAAVAEDGEVISRIRGCDRFSHLQNLMPQVKQVLDEAGLQIGDMTAIAVSRGPGSFTGIRIGVSSARALAQVCDIPCVGVSSLEALAMQAQDSAEEGFLICPILDARRSQVYGGGYLLRDGRAEEVVKAGPYTVQEFVDAVRGYGRLYFMGDGTDKYCGEIEELLGAEAGGPESGGITLKTAPESVRYQNAVTVAVLGTQLFNEGKSCSYSELQPDYMRMAEAERKLKERQAEEADG